MATQKVIIREKHKKDCAAIDAVNRGDWDHPWFLPGDCFWGDRAGGRRSTLHRWNIFKCNDPGCPARGIVLTDWLEKLIYMGSRSAAQEAKETSK